MDWFLIILIYAHNAGGYELTTLQDVKHITFRDEVACNEAIKQLTSIKTVKNSMFCIPNYGEHYAQ